MSPVAYGHGATLGGFSCCLRLCAPSLIALGCIIFPRRHSRKRPRDFNYLLLRGGNSGGVLFRSIFRDMERSFRQRDFVAQREITASFVVSVRAIGIPHANWWHEARAQAQAEESNLESRRYRVVVWAASTGQWAAARCLPTDLHGKAVQLPSAKPRESTKEGAYVPHGQVVPMTQCCAGIRGEI
jgi:hypothetical protein